MGVIGKDFKYTVVPNFLDQGEMIRRWLWRSGAVHMSSGSSTYFGPGQVPAAPMQEAPLRMLPQGVVIRGETTRGVGAMRLAAVFAVLVSLLAVACVVLMQPSAGAVGGKRTTELSLDTAMSTFFKNTAEHEERLAAAQALEMQHLAAVIKMTSSCWNCYPLKTPSSAVPNDDLYCGQ